MFVSVNSYCRHYDGRAVFARVYLDGVESWRVQAVNTAEGWADVRENGVIERRTGAYTLTFHDKQGQEVPASEVLVFTPDPNNPGEWL